MKIIGICGPSCSGKSCVAKLLAQDLNASILCLDNFIIQGARKIYVNYKGQKIRTFERPELYDGKRLARCVNELNEKGSVKFTIFNLTRLEEEEVFVKKNDYLILEGFLLFQFTELTSLMDYKFFIDLPFREVVSRRVKRADRPKADNSFVLIGYQENKKFCLPQKDFPGVIILDGKKTISELKTDILFHINQSVS
ncbi:AAA family ATPase [Candidatus Woesearchaeota archaeon]|nr:AAA family ATPase [Candidatus Woesearchaeota archaeon]